MGKKTLYHPVSFNVIRGAAEFHGFTLGKFRQTWANAERRQAGYTVEVLSCPSDANPIKTPVWKIARILRSAFAEDITVLSVWANDSGELVARIFCDLSHSGDPRAAKQLEFGN